jgi:hypothetical protein
MTTFPSEMDGQMSLDDVGPERPERERTGEELRDEAMRRVERNGTEEAKAALEDCLTTCIRLGDPFMTDEVWSWKDKKYPHVPIHEGRLLGPIVARAVREGRIESTGRTQKSGRAVCHKNPKTIWRPVP